jgi:hypothetical protein
VTVTFPDIRNVMLLRSHRTIPVYPVGATVADPCIEEHKRVNKMSKKKRKCCIVLTAIKSLLMFAPPAHIIPSA